MTVDEIIDRANTRFNAQQNRFGMLTRQDLIDFFATLDPNADRKEQLTQFFDNFPFLTSEDREKVYGDLASYQ